MMGVTGTDINQLMADEEAWQARLLDFRNYQSLWLRHGFIMMLQTFLRQEKVRERLLALPLGERSLTNVLHAQEILQQATAAGKLGMGGLLKWLEEQGAREDAASEEHQLRLENDGNAVNIITIHKAKGLQFNITFCPFLSKEVKASDPPEFHDRNNKDVLTLDLGSATSTDHAELATQEVLAEDMRLIYVALTRAKHRCYLACGNFKSFPKSALHYLLTNAGSAFAEKLHDLVKTSKQTIVVTDWPQATEKKYVPIEKHKLDLVLAPFARKQKLEKDWQVSSFSALSHSNLHELPDRDALLPATPAIVNPEEKDIDDKTVPGIFKFPRGTRPGTALHTLFEELDFQINDNALLKQTVQNILRPFYLSGENWDGVITEMVSQVLSTPLLPDSPDFSLNKLQPTARRHEMEFYFPLQKISPQTLQDIFSQTGQAGKPDDFPTRVGRLDFKPTQGFLKGYIDLVFQAGEKFYLLDWKSNHLGNNASFYQQDLLAAAMQQHFYTLQYHLYALALHCFLKLRMPDYRYEKHFGGAVYVFLRGVESKLPGNGIYFHRPAETLIQTMENQLIAMD